jgi:hypothetical protein
MAIDTWAVVLATFLGPIFAVSITLWRDDRKDTRNRRMFVFRNLMATRRMPISQEHVNALNLIEVEFYKCPSVEARWRDYKNHLYTGPEDDEWRKKKEKLLANLLFEIGKVLDFQIPALEIFEGGYAPGGWEYRDARAGAVLEYILAMAKNTASLPMKVVEFPADEEFARLQREYFKLAVENMRDTKMPPIDIATKSDKSRKG